MDKSISKIRSQFLVIQLISKSDHFEKYRTLVYLLTTQQSSPKTIVFAQKIAWKETKKKGERAEKMDLQVCRVVTFWKTFLMTLRYIVVVYSAYTFGKLWWYQYQKFGSFPQYGLMGGQLHYMGCHCVLKLNKNISIIVY